MYVVASKLFRPDIQ